MWSAVLSTVDFGYVSELVHGWLAEEYYNYVVMSGGKSRCNMACAVRWMVSLIRCSLGSKFVTRFRRSRDGWVGSIRKESRRKFGRVRCVRARRQAVRPVSSADTLECLPRHRRLIGRLCPHLSNKLQLQTCRFARP